MEFSVRLLEVRLLRFCLLLLSAQLFSASAMSGVNSWTTQGPPGGTFVSAASDPNDSKVIYAAYSKSLHKSTDGGDTWRTIREFSSQVSHLVVDADGKLFIAAWNDGIYRSDNAGNTFIRITPGSFAGPQSVGVSGSVVYYSSPGLFRRSADRGATWIARTTPPQTLTAIRVDPTNADSIFGFAGQFLVRSTDGGVTWSQTTIAANGMTASVNNALLFGSSSLIVCSSNGFFVSQDAGLTWVQNSIGYGCSALGIDPNASGAAFGGLSLGFQSGPLYRTADAGITWTSISGPLSGGVQSIVAGKGNPTPLVVVNSANAWFSGNFGTTWTVASRGPTASTPRLAATRGANAKTYAYNSPPTSASSALYWLDNDLWRKLELSSGAPTFSNIVSGSAQLIVKPGDPSTLYLGSSTLFRSINSGTSWLAMGTCSSGAGIQSITFDPHLPSTMYMEVAQVGPTLSSAFCRSIDSGSTWSVISTALPWNFGRALVVDPLNPQHLLIGIDPFAAPSIGGLYESFNGGVTWTQRFVDEDVRDIEFDPIDPHILYVATTSGLQKSIDGGVSFTPNAAYAALTSQPVGSIVIDPTAPYILYTTSFDPNAPSFAPRFSSVLRSVDAGLSWEILRNESDQPNWLVSQLLLDPNTPSILHASVVSRGVISFEVAPDVALSIGGHAGVRTLGAPASFNVRAQNDGAFAATQLQIVVSLPSGLSNVTVVGDRGPCTLSGATATCTVNVLKPGQAANANFAYTPNASMSIPINASVSGHERDSVVSNNSVAALAVAGQVVDLDATLTPSTLNVTDGDSVSYTLTIKNKGPIEAADAVARLTTNSALTFGPLPSGCNTSGTDIVCNTGALSVNATKSFVVPATLHAVGAATATLSAETTSDAVDDIRLNNVSAITLNALPLGDLAISISDSLDPVPISTHFDYRVVVRNLGPDSLPNVVSNIVGSGALISFVSTRGTCASSANGLTCNFGTMSTGESATVTVTTASSAAGSSSLTASATSDGTDRVTANNSAQELTTISLSSGSGGSGGGALPLPWISLLILMLLWQRPHHVFVVSRR